MGMRSFRKSFRSACRMSGRHHLDAQVGRTCEVKTRVCERLIALLWGFSFSFSLFRFPNQPLQVSRHCILEPGATMNLWPYLAPGTATAEEGGSGGKFKNSVLRGRPQAGTNFLLGLCTDWACFPRARECQGVRRGERRLREGRTLHGTAPW